jgi:hypothetical protein
MSTPRYCGQCGKPLHADDRGERRCENGHRQTDAAQLVAAMRELVPVLRDVRADVVQALEDQGVELRSLREEVEALRAEGGSADAHARGHDELVELVVMARKLNVSPDWLRRHAEELGGRQSKKGGRWKFHPATALELFGSTERAGAPEPARWAPAPRPLPSKVPLLDMKGRAA